MIRIGKNTVPLSFEWQTSPLGEVFKLSSIIKGSKEQWSNKVLKNDWYYVFQTKENGYFSFYEDVSGVIKEKLNNKQTIEILCLKK